MFKVVPHNSSSPLWFCRGWCCQFCRSWSKESCICTGLFAKKSSSWFEMKTDCRMPRLLLILSWRILFWDPRYLQDPTTSQTIPHPSGHYPVELAQLQCLQQCDRIRNQTVQCWHTLLGPQVGISCQPNIQHIGACHNHNRVTTTIVSQSPIWKSEHHLTTRFPIRSEEEIVEQVEHFFSTLLSNVLLSTCWLFCWVNFWDGWDLQEEHWDPARDGRPHLLPLRHRLPHCKPCHPASQAWSALACRWGSCPRPGLDWKDTFQYMDQMHFSWT